MFLETVDRLRRHIGGLSDKHALADITGLAAHASRHRGAGVDPVNVKGADITSAATVDLAAATGTMVHITGTVTITALGTVQAGMEYTLVFDGALTLTHNATSLILQNATNLTTAAGDVLTFASEGAGNWRELSRRLATATTAGKVLVSRYINNAILGITSAAAGYTDFGGGFTTAVTTLTGDQVVIRVQSLVRKQTSGIAAIVLDRSATKLPAAANSSVVVDVTSTFYPFLFEYVDAPAAGTYTYKPQLYNDDTSGAAAGASRYCQFVVEVWR